MRAHTTTSTTSRPKRKARHVGLALALGIAALAIPATANAQPTGSDPSTVNAITGGSSEASQPVGGSDYSSVNSIAPPASEPSGSADVGYSSLNAISGSPADAPTFVSSSPTGSGEGFDWPSALVGAGAALAMAALGGAALLTVRRRRTVSPSPSTS
jgi:hypothetical protein